MKISNEDIIQTIELIKLIYPNSYNTKTAEDYKSLVRTFYEIFRNFPKEIFIEAVRRSMTNSEYAPKPATIMAEIRKMSIAMQKSDTDLWAELVSVLPQVYSYYGRFSYTIIEENGKTQGQNAEQEIINIYNNLDVLIQEYCSNINEIITISRMSQERLAFEKGRFLKTMPSIRERQYQKTGLYNSIGISTIGEKSLNKPNNK